MNFTCSGGSSSVFQERVERALREHVNFVNDEDLVARQDRPVARVLDDLTDVVDAGVGGGVHLDDVGVAAAHDVEAVGAVPSKSTVGLPATPGFSYLSARARMRAVVVLPTPRTPVSM